MSDRFDNHTTVVVQNVQPAGPGCITEIIAWLLILSGFCCGIIPGIILLVIFKHIHWI